MKVRTLMDKHCSAEGSVRPVDVLLDLGYLKEKDLNAFLSGRVPYLEKVCTANLSKLKTVLDEMSSYAKERGYKEMLRFSKSGSPYIVKKVFNTLHQPFSADLKTLRAFSYHILSRILSLSPASIRAS